MSTDVLACPPRLEDPDADDARSADEPVRDNLFKPQIEEGEEARLKTKEADDDRARMWLMEKYKGVLFVDEDVNPPEYRAIVGLEWNARKPHRWDMAACRRVLTPGGSGRSSVTCCPRSTGS